MKQKLISLLLLSSISSFAGLECSVDDTLSHKERAEKYLGTLSLSKSKVFKMNPLEYKENLYALKKIRNSLTKEYPNLEFTEIVDKIVLAPNKSGLDKPHCFYHGSSINNINMRNQLTLIMSGVKTREDYEEYNFPIIEDCIKTISKVVDEKFLLPQQTE
jgi:hypothetical protein